MEPDQSTSHWPTWPPPLGLELERTPATPCPYLPDRGHRLRGFAVDFLPSALYQQFLDTGFRRSGRILYQPACDGCRSCVPLRIPVAEFRPNRSQRRCLAANQDLSVTVGLPEPSETKRRLFEEYLTSCHSGSPMENDPGSFDEFLYLEATDSLEFSYSLGQRLVAVSLCDLTPECLSAVYAYRDPEFVQRGLGSFCVLTELAWARRAGRAHHYLGYWIAACRKMAYKDRFRPCEGLDTDGVWRPIR